LVLRDLVAGLPGARVRGDLDLCVTGLAYDSRRVRPGDLFIAWPGFAHDGHSFIPQALARGAAACLVEREGWVPPPAAEIVVPDARRAAGDVAAAFYGHPTRSLRLIGVTGTKGKTTTTFLAREVLSVLGPVGLVGTVANVVGGRPQPVRHTTPEAVDLQGLFREMVDAGDRFAVAEVSSHALHLHRVEGCEFDVGVFTNLSQDHLDLHRTLDEYLAAKAKLFQMLGRPGGSKAGPKSAVLNADDPRFEQLRAVVRVPLITYGVRAAATVTATEVDVRPTGASFTARHPDGAVPVRLALTGRFNVYNALAAFCVGLACGMAAADIAEALGRVSGVPGRLEVIPGGQPFAVLVDYAHSPDSLRSVLETAREFASGRVIVVFGAGGDRDRTKRPLMGEIAASCADLVFLTSDNPRSEEPEAIIAEIEAGVRRVSATSYRVVPERREAIRAAVAAAGPGDVLVVAGKGHETYQIFRDRTVPFDDRHVAAEALRSLGY
jgi:UDP-N-acetylmuramoyl-L-alanyl-D-glutamate--2,6-diaminopimelate ligase